MKKRIGVVMYQTSNSKGQELIAKSQVREFNKRGDRAWLITGPFRDSKRVVSKRTYGEVDWVVHHYSDLPIIRVDGYIPEWPLRRVMFYNFPDTLGKIVRKFKIDVLIVHSNNWNGPSEIIELTVWNKRMRKLGLAAKSITAVYMPHYQAPDPKRYSKKEIASRNAWVDVSMKNVLKHASLILNVTPLEKKEMVDLGASASKCHLYPNGVDDQLFREFHRGRFSSFRKKYRIPEGKKIISYLGTIEHRKNPVAVAKIAKLLRENNDLFFVIAGKNGSSWQELKRMTKNMSNVRITGEISNREKVILIMHSYLNIILSRSEALGIAQL